MNRRNLRTASWILWAGVAWSLFGTAMPARAQWLNKLKQYGQKAQDLHKATTITVDQEKDIGREVAAKMVGFFHVYNNPGVTQYVNLVGATVAAQASRQDIQYHFAVLDSNDINAFSAPGGYVFVTRGALALCDDESELAGVLAHEVAHVADKHVVHVIERDQRFQAGMQEAQAHMGSNQYTQWVQNAAKNVTVKIIDQGLAPGDEFDADRDGVSFAHAAGYPADGLERFLVKLDKATNQGANSFWTRTHPPVADRNSRIQQQIASEKWQDADRPKLADRYSLAIAAMKKS